MKAYESIFSKCPINCKRGVDIEEIRISCLSGPENHMRSLLDHIEEIERTCGKMGVCMCWRPHLFDC
jgi:hypothetical protein